MLNLLMAGFWLIVGGLLLGWQWLHPENRRLTILGTGISIGWMAFLFGLYKLARWWSGRSFIQHREALDKTRLAQRLPEERRPTQPAATPDPNFNFTDEPPAER